MSLKRTSAIILGSILLACGIILNLAFSSILLWGELEARLFAPQSGDKSLRIECPLMIASWETATIHTVVTNSLTDQSTKPQMNAIISHDAGPRLVIETLELAPLESRALQWDVDKADIVFNRLILVNILQRRYRDLPPRQGACSILVYNLFGLTGSATLILLVSIGVLAGILGAAMLYLLLRPLTERTRSFMQFLGVVLSLILLGLLAALTRRWGWTLVIDAAALIAITTGSVEIFFKRT